MNQLISLDISPSSEVWGEIYKSDSGSFIVSTEKLVSMDASFADIEKAFDEFAAKHPGYDWYLCASLGDLPAVKIRWKKRSEDDPKYRMSED